jgi:hypothetical protein
MYVTRAIFHAHWKKGFFCENILWWLAPLCYMLHSNKGLPHGGVLQAASHHKSCTRHLVWFYFLGVRWDWMHLVSGPLLAYCTSPGWQMMYVEQAVGWELAVETEVLRENLPQCTLSTTNPTWPDLGSNRGRRGEKPATNRLSYGTAILDI